MIAICDHNTAGNVAAVQEAAAGRLAVLAGIEVTTAEEIHVVGIFPDIEAAEDVGRKVQAALPPRARAVPRLLSAGCALGLAEAVALIHGHGGLAVAAHVDRPSYSVVSQLGIFPQGAGFDAVEVSAAGARRNAECGVRNAEWKSRVGIPAALPVLCGSDAHSLEELGGGRTLLDVDEPGFAGLRRALSQGGVRGWRYA